MEESKECCQCGATENLYSLESGKYACKNCLNELGKEQKEIQDKIISMLEKDYEIIRPENQAKCLEAITINILLKNNLLGKDIKDEIIKKAKELGLDG